MGHHLALGPWWEPDRFGQHLRQEHRSFDAVLPKAGMYKLTLTSEAGPYRITVTHMPKPVLHPQPAP